MSPSVHYSMCTQSKALLSFLSFLSFLFLATLSVLFLVPCFDMSRCHRRPETVYCCWRVMYVAFSPCCLSTNTSQSLKHVTVKTSMHTTPIQQTRKPCSFKASHQTVLGKTKETTEAYLGQRNLLQKMRLSARLRLLTPSHHLFAVSIRSQESHCLRGTWREA